MPVHDYELNRFFWAQDGIYPQVINELKSGKKQRHWMWFIFPQLVGIGYSRISKKYAIADLDEARAYLKKPLLSDRLCECTDLVLLHKNRTVSEIFGFPDDLKFHACMTLFAQADDNDASEFREATNAFFDGKTHQQKIDILDRQSLGGLTD